MQRKSLAIAAAVVATVFGAAGANALSIDVHKTKNAKVKQVDDDTIVFKTKDKDRKSKAVFEVALSDLVAASAAGGGNEVDVEMMIVKKNGKKKERTITLEDPDAMFKFKNKRRVVMDFSPSAVPEPSVLALLGAGVGGLALAGRRRR